jgi:outer membrane protein TolC
MSSPSTPAHFTLGALALAALLLAGAANAQTPPVKRVADALVAEALASSLGLAANAATVAQKQAALDAVRAEYLPQLDLQLRYTEADGGRTIEIPALGLDFRFLREREQDSVLRLTQPLFDARLAALRLGAAHDADAARYGLAAYRAALARDVRQAYYRWLAAREAIGVLEATAALARENERVNDSLHRNGKVTRDLLLRAEAERLEVGQQLVRARATESLARRYLNLLCNAPLEREPEAAAVSDADLPLLAAGIPARNGARLEEAALSARAELRQLDAGLAAAGASERAARAAFKPQLALAVDAGTQGADWGYDDHDPYVLASLVVRFNLWNGGGDRAALSGARARSAELEAGRALAEQRIRIEVLEALTGLEVAEATLATAGRRVEAAAAAYAIVAKKRDLGQVSPAEYLDAQRTLTEARLNGNVTRFEALAALAQVEYAIGAMEQQP